MKALLIRKYGGPEVLEVAEVPAPKAGEHEVVVEVSATSVNPVDWLVRDGGATSFVKVTFPVILGCDLAGRVVEVGPKVTRVSVGDEVFAMMPHDWGAHAERVALAEDLVVPKPAGLSMIEAAALPTVAMTALNGLKKAGGVQAGERVLINGASSSVGLAAIQIAKSLGADVTAVCSESSFDLVKSFGADHLVDYKTTNFLAANETYEMVFDCIGNHPYSECKHLLRGRSVHATTVPGVRTFIRQFVNPLCRVKVFALLTTGNGEDLSKIKSLIEAGKLTMPIDKIFPYREIAAAQEYSKAGRAKGKIVLDMTR